VLNLVALGQTMGSLEKFYHYIQSFKVSQGHQNDMDQSDTYDFLLMLHSIMGLYHTFPG